MPYVSPEQWARDKADFARKGIGRGRSLVAIAYDQGVLFVAENPSATLNKIGEIYDTIAFAAVGRYNEFEALRQGGIRLADMRGYQYARSDVTARSLANAYGSTLNEAFTNMIKPMEVELLLAELTPTTVELYHILYDGSITDEEGFVAIGGSAEGINEQLGRDFQPGMDRDTALRTARQALGAVESRAIEAERLEVAGLDRGRGRRKFFRLPKPAVESALQHPV